MKTSTSCKITGFYAKAYYYAVFHFANGEMENCFMTGFYVVSANFAAG